MSFEPPPKVCPRCGEEYLHSVAACADCGVALVGEGEAPRPEQAASTDALPPASELIAVRSAGAVWITGLAESLQAAGIPCRVELAQAAQAGRGAGGPRCTLWVRPEDVDGAARIDVEFARTQIPDLPEQVTAGWAESEACPACGTALEPGAAECAECGLVFAGEE